MMESSNGAWVGEIPKYLKEIGLSSSSNEENTTSDSLQKFDEDIKPSAQDIASYQVVQST